MKLQADGGCRACRGSGIIVEHHPYGSTTAAERFYCDCFKPMDDTEDDNEDRILSNNQLYNCEGERI